MNHLYHACFLVIFSILAIGCSNGTDSGTENGSTDSTSSAGNKNSTSSNSTGKSSTAKPGGSSTAKKAKLPIKVVSPTETYSVPAKYEGMDLRYPSLSPDGDMLFFIAQSSLDIPYEQRTKHALLFNLKNKSVVHELPYPHSSFNAGLKQCEFRSDGQQLVELKDHNTMLLISIPEGEIMTVDLPQLENESRLINVGYSRDGKTAYVLRKNGIQLVNSETGSLAKLISLPQELLPGSYSVSVDKYGMVFWETSKVTGFGVDFKEGEELRMYFWHLDETQPKLVGQFKTESSLKFLLFAATTAIENQYIVGIGGLAHLYNSETGELGEGVDMTYAMRHVSTGPKTIGYQRDGGRVNSAFVPDLKKDGLAVIEFTSKGAAAKMFYEIPDSKPGSTIYGSTVSLNGNKIVAVGEGKIHVFDTVAFE